MTEIDENLFRNLLTRFREEDPRRFLDLVFEALLIRMGSGTISALRNKDDGTTIAMAIVFKGLEVIDTAEKTIAALLQEYDSDPDDQETSQ